MEQTFIRMGIEVPSQEQMKATIGLPLKLALQQLGAFNDEEAEKATETYRELFPTFEVEYIKVFEGVTDTLSFLHDKGIRMAIVTSRDRYSLELVAGKRGLMPLFETCVTGADGYRPKPAPDMVLALLDRMKIQASEAMVVGDTTFDIGMGNQALCPTIAVTYGNHSRERLASGNPTYIIDTFREIKEIIP